MAEAVTLLEQDGLVVEAAVYPLPDYDGNPWSQWGQGIVLGDGRFLSAVGDHLGADGSSYVYEYDPAARTLRMVADLLELTDHRPGQWGYGKVHGQMVSGSCGEVYLTTYWGTRRGLSYGGSYQGDLLFRLDPQSRTIDNLGVLVPEHGVPSLAGWEDGGLIYAEAVDPASEGGANNAGPFVVYDVAAGEITFRDDDPDHAGFRAMAVDREGRAYFSVGEGRLAVFDPDTGSVSELADRLPGEWLRAATVPDPNGLIFGVTQQPEVLFVLDPDAGTIRPLGPARGYTTSLGLGSDGATVYYVPDAHGGSWQQGTPVVAVDTATGTESVLVELNPAAEERLGLRLGGTYNVAVDGNTLYLGMNAGLPGQRDTFGRVVLIVVHLPG